MIEPTSGTILVDGKDIMAGDPASCAGHRVRDPAGRAFRTGRSWDNVATVPVLLGWDKKRARERAAELRRLVGLVPEMAKRYRRSCPAASSSASGWPGPLAPTRRCC